MSHEALPCLFRSKTSSITVIVSFIHAIPLRLLTSPVSPVRPEAPLSIKFVRILVATMDYITLHDKVSFV